MPVYLSCRNRPILTFIELQLLPHLFQKIKVGPSNVKMSIDADLQPHLFSAVTFLAADHDIFRTSVRCIFFACACQQAHILVQRVMTKSRAEWLNLTALDFSVWRAEYRFPHIVTEYQFAEQVFSSESETEAVATDSDTKQKPKPKPVEKVVGNRGRSRSQLLKIISQNGSQGQ